MNLTLEDLKEAQRVLSEKFGTGAVMGGAVRDVLCGRPVKDIDFYVEHDELLYTPTGNMEWLQQGDAAYDHNYLAAVEDDADEFIGLPVQLMVVAPSRTIMQVLESFDIGLCMAAIDTNSKLYLHDNFVQDARDETLTVYRHGWGETGVQKHVERLLLKYDGWTVVRHDEGETNEKA